MEHPNLRNGKQIHRLIAVTILDVVSVADRGVEEYTGELIPGVASALLVPGGLGGFLPVIDSRVDKHRRRRFEGSVRYRDGCRSQLPYAQNAQGNAEPVKNHHPLLRHFEIKEPFLEFYNIAGNLILPREVPRDSPKTSEPAAV